MRWHVARLPGALVDTLLNVTHPIHYQEYNICSMVENNTLKNLKLAVLKLLCESFNLAVPPGVDQRKKKTYIALLEELVRCCSSSAVLKANGKSLLKKN